MSHNIERTRILIVIYFLACFYSIQVKPQVCEGTKIYTRQRMSSYTRSVLKTFIKKTRMCCNGYTLAGWLSSEEPICEPSCPNGCKDGYCARPNVCVCNKGYTKDEFHKCVPNTFRQHRRYIQRRNIISLGQNLIKKARTNDDEDYSETGSGYSSCSTECENGICVGSECICKIGFRKIMNICTPTCNPECINGYCSYPSLTCNCFEGYNLINDTCKPDCKYGCKPGTCETSHSNCDCNDGFRKSGFDDCIPDCSPACRNSRCIAPNTCACYPGYKSGNAASTEINNRFMCVPECENCNGSCIAPNKCIIKCNPPYEAVRTTEHGVCDNDNSDIKECYATVCKIKVSETNITGEEKENDYFYWITGAAILGVILVVILVLIAARKYLANCCKRRNYDLEDKNNGNPTGDTHNLGILKTAELNKLTIE